MNVSDVPPARAIRGPITLITVGILFALNNFTTYSFNETWPVLLIVFGLLSLLSRGAQGSRSRAAGSPGFPPYGFPPPTFPPAPGSSTTGGYRQSSYTATSTPPPPASPARGGFGSSAPPRQGDTGQTPSAPPPTGDTK